MRLADDDVMGDTPFNLCAAQSETNPVKTCPLKIVDGEIDANVSRAEDETGAWPQALSGR